MNGIYTNLYHVSPKDVCNTLKHAEIDENFFNTYNLLADTGNLPRLCPFTVGVLFKLPFKIIENIL